MPKVLLKLINIELQMLRFIIVHIFYFSGEVDLVNIPFKI